MVRHIRRNARREAIRRRKLAPPPGFPATYHWGPAGSEALRRDPLRTMSPRLTRDGGSHGPFWSALEERLRTAGLRGHVYLTTEGPTVLSTSTKDATYSGPGKYPERKMIGSLALISAAALVTNTPKDTARAQLLRAAEELKTPASPPDVRWNTPYLLITGVTATHVWRQLFLPVRGDYSCR